MSRIATTRARGRRRTAVLAGFLVLQSVAAAFFVGDALADVLNDPVGPHTFVEALVAVVLVIGIVLGGSQLRHMLERMRDQERALETARGGLSQVIDAQFADWKLTPAERDVGLLALKGLDVAEIAGVRGAASGTVRAQLTRIYAKAGVSGRAQFAAWFVEDLLHEGLAGSREVEPVGKDAAQDAAQSA
jgi:DNA-binding CsgD family transcriptional regulator